jgi:thiol-disulfide isomerase/thioredoxin
MSSNINVPSTSFSNVKSIVIIVLILIVTVFICYYVYIKFFSPKIAELYKPNNEQVPKWGNSKSSSNEAELYFFYANWCPYCKSAKPEWEKVKKEYENKTINGYKVIFIDVDCSTPNNETNKLMDNYNIEGFPTIKLNKNGSQINYDAKVTYTHLTDFLKTAL